MNIHQIDPFSEIALSSTTSFKNSCFKTSWTWISFSLLGTAIGIPAMIVKSLAHRTAEIAYPLVQLVGRFFPIGNCNGTFSERLEFAKEDVYEAGSLAYGFLWVVTSDISSFTCRAILSLFYVNINLWLGGLGQLTSFDPSPYSQRALKNEVYNSNTKNESCRRIYSQFLPPEGVSLEPDIESDPSILGYGILLLLPVIGIPTMTVRSLVGRAAEVAYPCIQLASRFLPLEDSPYTFKGSLTFAKEDAFEASCLAYGFPWMVISDVCSFAYPAVLNLFYPSYELLCATYGNGIQSSFKTSSYSHRSNSLAKQPQEELPTKTEQSLVDLNLDPRPTLGSNTIKQHNSSLFQPHYSLTGGLPNIGNSCWMNSGIQYLFHSGDIFRNRLQQKLDIIEKQKELSNILEAHLNNTSTLEQSEFETRPEYKLLFLDEIKKQIKQILSCRTISREEKRYFNDLLQNLSLCSSDNPPHSEIFTNYEKEQTRWNTTYGNALSLEKITPTTVCARLKTVLQSPVHTLLYSLDNVMKMLDNPTQPAVLSGALHRLQDNFREVNPDNDGIGEQIDANNFCSVIWDYIDDLPQDERLTLKKSGAPVDPNPFFVKEPTYSHLPALILNPADMTSNLNFTFNREEYANKLQTNVVNSIKYATFEKCLLEENSIPQEEKSITPEYFLEIQNFLKSRDKLNINFSFPSHAAWIHKLKYHELEPRVSEKVAQKYREEEKKHRDLWDKKTISLASLISHQENMEASSDEGGALVPCVFNSQVVKYPKNLFIQLNRTGWDMEGRPIKNSLPVCDIDPNGYIVLEQYIEATGLTEKKTYEIVSAICHHGWAHGGHYTLIKKKTDGSFCEYNDGHVINLIQKNAIDYIKASTRFHFRLVPNRDTGNDVLDWDPFDLNPASDEELL